MIYVHIVQFHLMQGGGVGSVITDVAEQMVKNKAEVYVFSLFKSDSDNMLKQKKWAHMSKVMVKTIQQDGDNYLSIILKLRNEIKKLSQTDKVALFLHLKWGVLAGVLATIGLKKIICIEVYHSGYMRYKLQASVCKYFIDSYIAVSNEAKSQLTNYFKISPKKISVISNGVDIEAIKTIISTKHRNNDGFNFLSVGRLSYEKGFDISIRGYISFIKMQYSEQVSYSMVGDGPDMSKCKTISDGKVDFWGNVPRIQVFEFIRDSDIVVMPSLWEGNSILLLEVLAVGKAVIVSDIPSFREVLCFSPLEDTEEYRIEKFGIVCRKGSANSFALAMKWSFNNKEEVLKMSHVIGALADKYSIKNQSVKYMEIARKQEV